MTTVQSAWCRETSADPDGWTEANPAYGQCAVTALVVQDTLGGVLLRAVNAGVSHYWNRLPTGDEIDLTREQFDTWDPSPAEPRTRAYVLSHPDTARRYALLRARTAGDTIVEEWRVSGQPPGRYPFYSFTYRNDGRWDDPEGVARKFVAEIADPSPASAFGRWTDLALAHRTVAYSPWQDETVTPPPAAE